MSVADHVKRFHDITIVTGNVAELRRFYASLGFRQVVDGGNDLAVFLVGTNELAIHTGPERPRAVLVLGIVVDDLASVQRTCANLGITLAPPAPLRPGLVGVSVLDPNGNRLEFLQPVD